MTTNPVRFVEYQAIHRQIPIDRQIKEQPHWAHHSSMVVNVKKTPVKKREYRINACHFVFGLWHRDYVSSHALQHLRPHICDSKVNIVQLFMMIFTFFAIEQAFCRTTLCAPVKVRTTPSDGHNYFVGPTLIPSLDRKLRCLYGVIQGFIFTFKLWTSQSNLMTPVKYCTCDGTPVTLSTPLHVWVNHFCKPYDGHFES